ncbi:MAG: indolepyruvate ferredoxin oxidoreductase subunit alpha [Candidatus Rokubacteria bacterium]|nr:indolepyruvate ferredoxin oxidoreductase subunit alpha [Candidatus Rokubacteria bacterium]
MGRNYSKEDLAQLRLGKGAELHGDGSLVVLKALLESGVSYLGGYPGAPTSSLYDAIADAYHDVLEPMGIYFEGSGNEASAGALLSLSVHYPVRGAVNWKVVGSNVAADALAHVAASGVYGGALILVGEDYGCNSTTVAEKTLPYAQKSTCAVIDPKGDPATMARMVREGFRLSEASHMPVFYLFRTRTGNMKGSMACEDNQEPPISMKNPLRKPEVQLDRMTIPPYVFDQEREKFAERIPAARDYIVKKHLNERILGEGRGIGIVTHGMVFNTTVRALHSLGEADLAGKSWIDVLCLNVIAPLVPQEVVDFLQDKREVLIVEEGMPNLLEQEIRAIAQERRLSVRLYGKDLLPMPGEYTPPVLIQGIGKFLTRTVYATNGQKSRVEGRIQNLLSHLETARRSFALPVSTRNPVFCTGCPERPVFSALKIMQKTYERPHYAQDTGCYAMGSMAPFDTITGSYTGMGTGLASAGALSKLSDKPVVSFMGDGTFWHSGLTTSIANAVYNRQNSVLVIFENFWTSMTGQQENPASGHNIRGEPTPRMSIPGVLKEMGVKWIRQTNPYNLTESVKTVREAMEATGEGLRVIVSHAECMLEKQRRGKPEKKAALAAGATVEDVKLGVDDEVCTGDHSCMRFNGCPSLTVKPGPNPLREDPIATIVNSCVGCGLCGEVAHAAVLCPSFYEAKVVSHPSAWQRVRFGVSRALIRGLLGVRV